LIRFADEVYDARYEKDSAFIKNEASNDGVAKLPQTFPDFVYEFAAKRYGLKALVSTNCWGMVSSVELQRGQHAGIDLYGKFLEETYDATDLLFFLFARSAIERVTGQDTGDKNKEDGEDKAKTKAKVKSVKSVTPPALEAKQVYQVVKMAIDSKRQDLRDLVIRRLDTIMAARQDGSGRKLPLWSQSACWPSPQRSTTTLEISVKCLKRRNPSGQLRGLLEALTSTRMVSKRT